MTWKRDVDADKEALHGGRECGPLEQELDCNTHECGVNATMSEWESCGPCSVSCGSGEQKFCRHELTPKNQYGRPALDTLESRQCFLANCYAECKIEKEWYPVQTECSKSCGGGTQVFQRVVTGGSKNGPSCPPSQELRSCNPEPCPIDCEYDKWIPDPTPCSKTCGGGKRRYTRAYKHGSENNGEPCEHLEKEEDCNMFDCPQDCVVSDWKSDGVCSAHLCGDGTQLFTRSIIVTDQEKQNDWGRPCPYTSEYRVCTLGPCAL
jgi:hypothetical protein